MTFDVEDSLRATFYGLIAIWVCGSLGLLLFTGKVLFAIIYLCVLGPVLTVIYLTAKSELMGAASRSRNKKKQQAIEPLPSSEE